MLPARAQTCELCQMFAGAPFFSAELHLLLGQTTIMSTLFEVRLNQFWLWTSLATSFTWSFGCLLLTRCHPPLSGGKTPTCLGWHHGGCDGDIACYLEDQTETEWGLKWETEEQMEKKGTYGPAVRGCGPWLQSTVLLFAHCRPHNAA